MMPWFIWKGKNSLADFGLWVTKFPKRTRPEERHEEIEIPGRAGSLIVLEGEDVYDPYESELVVTARNDIDLHNAMDWLRGSGQMVYSIDTEKAVPARIVGKVEFERVSNTLSQATIPLYCEPFRVARYPGKDKIAVSSSGGTIVNPGDIASKPKVSIAGSGNVTVSIAGKSMSFTSVSGTIVVDCDAHIVTQSGQIWTGSYSGEFWKIPTGEQTIAITGTATIEITPNWRWF